jgi:glyoxylase-like metal-dependent hydrolase (beta-lactamase superfamily II)
MHSKTDTIQSSVEALRYPWENHPGPNEVVEVMPGVLWVRLKLPFRLNHVNIYLLADGDGWVMVDSGFGNEETIAAWTALFEGPLAHVKITRLLVTHSHPDHVGLAGWVVERFNCPLHMSQVEYLQSVYHQNRGTEERKMAQRLFFRRHGMDENLTDKLLGRGQDYLKRVSTLPPSYRRQTVPVGRSGAEQDLAQCQRVGSRTRSELARGISGFAGEPHHHPAL